MASHQQVVSIRPVPAADWPGIWPFVRRIVAEGKTFCWDQDLGEQQARELWFPAPPARTIVAVDPDDHILASQPSIPTTPAQAGTSPAPTSWLTGIMRGGALADCSENRSSNW